ncbi:MAG TPA: hypothetical protein VMJ35_00965 [Dongiaceae bacterium]|nr:hypothetical protein [Dongiaceae bacterium]
MKQTAEPSLSAKLDPLCPRENHRMKYEAEGIRWRPVDNNDHYQSLPSYRCGYEGCSVRYDLLNGYFTVVHTPEQPFFIEEPGVNILQCPRHGTWLYRVQSNGSESGTTWRCGVADCGYVREGPEASNS